MYVGYALEGDGGRVVGVKGERERGSVRKAQLQNKSGEKQKDSTITRNEHNTAPQKDTRSGVKRKETTIVGAESARMYTHRHTQRNYGRSKKGETMVTETMGGAQVAPGDSVRGK